MKVASEGSCFPLGPSFHNNTWNFAITSPHTVKELHIHSLKENKIIGKFPLDPIINRTGNVWHIALSSDEETFLYGFRIETDENVLCSHLSPLVFDPYAPLLKTGHIWGSNRWKDLLKSTGEIISVAHKGEEFPWKNEFFRPQNKERIIYEAHVRGMTQKKTFSKNAPGTFLAMIDSLKYLSSLGITTVELLPIYEWDETEWKGKNPFTNKRLYNYWGYSPLSFFSPMQRFGTTDDPIQTAYELKLLIQAAHEHGLEIILDVVYNHTGEGNQHGPAYSYKILDQDSYYIMENDGKNFTNYSGCGNTFNANHPIVSDLILASLRHFVLEYHVDGFRFDLASILTRNQMGLPTTEPDIIQRIIQDPILSKTVLITEPWDAAGLHQTGALYRLNQRKTPFFSEWNDRFRDDVRQFISGDDQKKGAFATRVSGSNDLYEEHPSLSINFVTSHDGFSLHDLVTYNEKHNLENGENNQDGTNANYSWNCGIEGSTSHRSIQNLRRRQKINFFVALFTSFGTPMILMGDEYGASRAGNNNSWCQDCEENYFDWKIVEKDPELVRLIKTLTYVRKASSCFLEGQTANDTTITWHGADTHAPNWAEDSSFIAYSLKNSLGEIKLFVAFNSSEKTVPVHIPRYPSSAWHTIVNSSKNPPKAIFLLEDAPIISSSVISMKPHSSLLLYAKRI